MLRTRSTNFFDLIKKETTAEPEATPFTINNEAVLNIDVKRQYIKEEIDIPWNETSYIVARDQDGAYFSEKQIFNARVIIDRLPDIIVKRYFRGKIKTIESYQNSAKEYASSSSVDKPSDIIVKKRFISEIKTIENHPNNAKECPSSSIADKTTNISIEKHLRSKIKTVEIHQNNAENVTSSSIDPENFTVKTRKSSKTKAHINKTNTSAIDKVPTSHFYWKLCTKCNKKYEYIERKHKQHHCRECKTRLIFECKRCQKQLPSVMSAKYHAQSQCVHRGYYYKCFECDSKANKKGVIVRHVRMKHPTMTSQMHRIEVIESNNVQDELDNAKIKRFECPTCEKKFEFLSTMMNHVQICTGKNSTANSENQCTSVQDLPENVRKRIMVYCGKCDKDVLYDKNTLKVYRHCKKICPDCKSIMTYKCSECKRQYVSRHGVAGHIRSVHNDRQAYKCPKCDYKTLALQHICVHYKNMHIFEIHAHECSKCGKKFDRHVDLYMHSRRCGLEPQYSCDHCSFKAFTKYELSSHLIHRHSTNTEIDCPRCKLTFKNEPTMKTHQRLCGKQPKLKCAHCPYKTKHRNALKQHLLRIHSFSNEIKCPNCKKMQRNEQCLKDHFRYCTKKDYLQCKFCSFKTKMGDVLRNHTLRFHAKGKDTCSVVGRSGKSYNITVKDYFCDHCSYRTNIRSVIYDHILRNHLKEKNIKCSQCKAKFQNSIYLKTHLKYCGLKPYLHCAHCSFKTYMKGLLTTHIKDNHTLYECSKCKKQLKGLGTIRAHRRRNNCKRIKSSRKHALKQKSL